MIYEYECMLCHFIFSVTTPYTTFTCPSCKTLVQAIVFNRKAHEPEEKKAFDPDARTPEGWLPS